MEQREHPRIHLPFEVEVEHPSLGTIRSIARDISESGLFVAASGTGIRVGSKVKVTVLASALAEGTPTPTIGMEVARLDDDGFGLKFNNRTSRHLWESVVRERDELVIGEDYFQVFQAAVVVNPQRKLLVVQQNGKWLFPGAYLRVGERWRETLEAFLEEDLDLTDVRFRETLEVDSGADVVAPERAMLSLFHRYSSDGMRTRLAPAARYSKAKWIGRTMGIDELTFSHPLLRTIAQRALERAETEYEAPSPGQRLPVKR
jgi:hypothetical protein